MARCGIISMLGKARIPFKLIPANWDKKDQKDVRDFVTGIEKARKRASKGNLVFKAQSPIS